MCDCDVIVREGAWEGGNGGGAGVCPRTLTGRAGEVRACTLQQRQHGGVQDGTLLALLVPWVQPAREGSESAAREDGENSPGLSYLTVSAAESRASVASLPGAVSFVGCPFVRPSRSCVGCYPVAVWLLFGCCPLLARP